MEVAARLEVSQHRGRNERNAERRKAFGLIRHNGQMGPEKSPILRNAACLPYNRSRTETNKVCPFLNDRFRETPAADTGPR